MTVQELMIGDWVYNKHFNGEIEPIQIHNIYGTEVNCKTERNCFDVDEIVSGTYMSDLQPIPLSPEILEKNFSSTTDWYFIGIDKFCFRINKYKDKWDLYFGRDGKGTNLQIKISYVHELQHALQLCGINKEIEL